ncbi:MAG: hypothetical protein SOZ59_12635 [Candidatus Limivivens sp.]|nr:hypothetical protein [Candidatus Limivivens sp.]
MKKKKMKRFFVEEMESADFREPYQKAIEKVTGILQEYRDFTKQDDHQRIELVTARMKTPQSAYEKLKRKGRQLTAENARRTLNDLAGVRVVCCYYEDVYQVANMLISRPELTLIKQKDFICSPKNSGYRSLHLIFEVQGIEMLPEEEILRKLREAGTGTENGEEDAEESEKSEESEESEEAVPDMSPEKDYSEKSEKDYSEETKNACPEEPENRVPGDPSLLPGVRVEIQIRTLTMDAWARLDHELRYKKEYGEIGKIMKALRKCSDSIAEVDDKMQEILEWIREA